MRTRRLPWILLGFTLAAVTLGGAPREALGSVSIAVTFDSLVRESSAVVVATPIEQRSIWEGERIYTYTRVHVDSTVAGNLRPEDDAWVRTMGGAVGKMGQVVEGEAGFGMGHASLVFLRYEPMGYYVVTARAQGQFGLFLDEHGTVRVQKGGAVGALFAPKGPNANLPLASDVIHARALSDAAKDIVTAWARLRAP